MWGWLQEIGNYFRHAWQRLLIAAICLGLVIARIIFPTIPVDWITLVLIAIAAFALIGPNTDDIRLLARRALPYIKKAKVAGIEVELSEEIRKLAIDVDKVQIELAEEKQLILASGYPAGETEVLQELKVAPRAALLLLGAKIEQQIMLQLAKHRLRKQGEYVPMHRAIEICVENGVFPKEILKPFKEFWNIRNQVAHGMASGVEESLVISLVSLGLEVLKLVSIEGGDGPDSPK
ncbi:MAG: hypothetical protein WD847_18560 [Pirellulales bacterium]